MLVRSLGNIYSRYLQEILEPFNSLQKSLFLGPFLLRIGKISPNGEAVTHPADEVDLPRFPGLDEDVLGFVPERGGEDMVDFWTTDNNTCD